MPKFRPKGEEIDAIQWTGSNVKTVENWAGEQVLDVAGEIKVPNFAPAKNWVPEAATLPDDESDGLYAINTGVNGWFVVAPDHWIVRRTDGSGFDVVTDEDFTANYEQK
jgi:hypothetical protein